MSDHVTKLARLRIVKASAELEVALGSRSGGGPAIEILRRLRDRAAESLEALAFADVENVASIRVLQNEVKRYDEWVVWMREIIVEGRTYDEQIKQEERDELLDELTQTSDGRQEAIDLGLVDDIPRDN